MSLSLPEQQQGCRVLEPEFQVTVNGMGTFFDDRGGGECRQVKLGGSVLAFSPPDPNRTVRLCSCRPAVVTAKDDGVSPMELTVCGAGSCAKAAWPSAPARPGLVVEPQADGWLLVRVVRTAPKDRDELLFVSILADGHSLSSHSTEQFLDDGSVRVWLSEFDTNVVARANWSTYVDASTCDFVSCARRPVGSSMMVRLK